ncbi:MAG TPA: hypothetical protein VF202_09820 [Trueperaceae bacterium]
MELPAGVVSGEAARLIPVVADSSREVRATSVLLAALQSVPTFAKALLATIGQSVSSRSVLLGYTETKFQTKDSEPDCRPDGYLLLMRGGKVKWSALVEAKIGRAELDEEQLRRYVALAKAQQIPAVITISNQFVALPTHHPVRLPKSMVRHVQLLHWSWMHILTEALLLVDSDDLENPAERFILSETIRYFSHPSVGASTHDQMNPEWRELVARVQAGAPLSRPSDMVVKTVEGWHQESRDLALLLTRQLGQAVALKLSRKEQRDPAFRLKEDAERLVSAYKLETAFAVPNAAAPISMRCDLRRRTIEVAMNLDAPSDRQRASSRINWLLRQLSKTDPDGFHVRTHWPGRIPPTQAPLAAVRADATLLLPEGVTALPSSFDVVLIRDLAGKFSGRRTFLEELEQALPYFYQQVGQHLRAYAPKPPRAPEAPGSQDDAEDSTEGPAGADETSAPERSRYSAPGHG